MTFINLLFTISFALILCYWAVIGLEKLNKNKKNWRTRLGLGYFKRRQRLDEINERYEQIRKSRREVLQHYYWAQSCDETEKAKRMEEEVQRIDHELDELREEYKLVEQGKQMPLKKV